MLCGTRDGIVNGLTQSRVFEVFASCNGSRIDVKANRSET